MSILNFSFDWLESITQQLSVYATVTVKDLHIPHDFCGKFIIALENNSSDTYSISHHDKFASLTIHDNTVQASPPRNSHTSISSTPSHLNTSPTCPIPINQGGIVSDTMEIHSHTPETSTSTQSSGGLLLIIVHQHIHQIQLIIHQHRLLRPHHTLPIHQMQIHSPLIPLLILFSKLQILHQL